ncbi:hypothetical protein V493_02749 [Pseudogymnoascus sp. VKM F-4281 (FW-2241)]|nr:hypothetical protein V493_02749 [Pseudogymnoascus sp. VKM F-4281 (FW-2241)]
MPSGSCQNSPSLAAGANVTMYRPPRRRLTFERRFIMSTNNTSMDQTAGTPSPTTDVEQSTPTNTSPPPVTTPTDNTTPPTTSESPTDLPPTTYI